MNISKLMTRNLFFPSLLPLIRPMSFFLNGRLPCDSIHKRISINHGRLQTRELSTQVSPKTILQEKLTTLKSTYGKVKILAERATNLGEKSAAEGKLKSLFTEMNQIKKELREQKNTPPKGLLDLIRENLSLSGYRVSNLFKNPAELLSNLFSKELYTALDEAYLEKDENERTAFIQKIHVALKSTYSAGSFIAKRLQETPNILRDFYMMDETQKMLFNSNANWISEIKDPLLLEEILINVAEKNPLFLINSHSDWISFIKDDIILENVIDKLLEKDSKAMIQNFTWLRHIQNSNVFQKVILHLLLKEQEATLSYSEWMAAIKNNPKICAAIAPTLLEKKPELFLSHPELISIVQEIPLRENILQILMDKFPDKLVKMVASKMIASTMRWD